MSEDQQNPFQSPQADARSATPINTWSLASPLLSLLSLFLSVCLLTWIGLQPAHTFHDQGGLLITLVLFPLACLGWIVSGLPGMIIGIVSLTRVGRSRHTASHMLLSLAGILLGAVGAVLVLAVLFIA